MCGIAGIMTCHGDAAPGRLLRAMGAALAHRGPDGDGHYRTGDVGMVQARLAIIDLATGDQPLYEPGGAALVANAEIYNYVELRHEFPESAFATQSDCELPLHLYRRHGLDFTSHLRGMFAIALHDPAAGRLVLARDPFGIKPLYYAETPQYFAFASEPQALIQAGIIESELAAPARNALLQMQFTTGRDTIFAGIKRVLPGETIVVRQGRIVERRRQEALPTGGPVAIDEDEAVQRLDSALADSVLVHQRADVPYGMFLSGGIDSATLITLMARLNKDPVRAYTAGFDAPGAADEREHAAAVAKAVGADHESIEVTESMVWKHLPEIVGCMDDPAADYAIIPTWFLARRAHQDVKVVLTGEGGDEIFAGYDRYRKALRPWWRGGRAMWARGSFDKVPVLRVQPSIWRDGMAAAEARALESGMSRLAASQAIDMTDWLPHDLLLKADRCLMAHAVEGRTPFLDKGVAAAAFRLPDSMKVRDGVGKWILRKWLEKNLPMARPFAPKQGFTVPVGEWIKGRGSVLGPLVARQPGVAEIAHPDRVEALFRDIRRWRHGFACWKLLFYALWHRRHILGLRPAGDVFATLSAPG
jgi:asparagine synthase (glutamine-hydrolysing)